MKKRWRKAFREELERDAEQIMKEVNSDPNLKDVKAPEGIHTRLMNQIQSERTQEERELIALGRIYKKRRKQNKFVVVAAAVLIIMALGITSLGGPERIIQTMRSMVGDRERTYVDQRGEQVTDVDVTDEEKAYQTIKEKFNVEPVGLRVLPTGMEFANVVIEEETQNARLYYESGDGKTIACTMWFNYRITTTGVGVEDDIIDTREMEISGNSILVKKYEDNGTGVPRWRVEFEHQKVQYFITLHGVTEAEIEKFVKNLYFY